MTGVAPTNALTSEKRVEDWRKIIYGDSKSWVLFRHGTCVILTQPESDLRAQAIALMREWGPVHPGSTSGDFGVAILTLYPGWLVRGIHSDILNYVSPDELSESSNSDVKIGLYGRDKRDKDAVELEIVHVEDKCSSV